MTSPIEAADVTFDAAGEELTGPRDATPARAREADVAAAEDAPWVVAADLPMPERSSTRATVHAARAAGAAQVQEAIR